MQDHSDPPIALYPVQARQNASDEWRWRPESGRWTPVFGLPRTPELVKLSTDAVSAGSAYDFWRELVFYNFDADPLDGEARPRFRAHGMGIPCEIAELYHWRSSAMQGRRSSNQIGRDGDDKVALGFVLDGERHAEDHEGQTFSSRRGQAFVYDSARESRLRWSDHEGIYIWLDRSAVRAALGTDMPSTAELTQRLAMSPMVGLIRDQLTTVTRDFEVLSEQERMFVLDQASRLATFALLRVGDGKPADDRSARSAVYAAALKAIERKLGASQLTPATIAAALGCSRATLYRAFADEGRSVMETVQAMRLNRAHSVLLATGSDVPVGDVAARCGYFDLSTFSAQFRRRFGCRPGDLRRK